MQTTVEKIRNLAEEGFDFFTTPTTVGQHRTQVRSWLNPPGWGSHAHAIFEYETTFGSNIELSIADCHRQITLDFRVNNNVELQSARYKLAQLRVFLNMVEEALDEGEKSLNEGPINGSSSSSISAE